MKFFILLFFAALAARAAPFSFNSIERWTGSGPNRAALIVDWHDGTRPHALAWGFRFENGATGLDMWNAVTAADTGLTAVISNGRPSDINYRRPSRLGGIDLPGTANHPGLARWTAYTFDHDDPGIGAWHLWTSATSQGVYAQSNMTLTADAPANIPLAHGSWQAWSLATNNIPVPPAAHPAAALHYPFASRVESYTKGGGIIFDTVTLQTQGKMVFFDDPATALGRPTVDTTGDNKGIAFTTSVPVVPVYGAFRHFEIVSLGSGGRLVLDFERPVYDNPENPHGAAFIVFGNAFQNFGGNREWLHGDPANITVGATCEADGGFVEVSHNLVDWHFVSPVYDDPNLVGYADDFAPTLGRVYDPANPDTTTLGAGNQWWGGATDPTIPVDPSITPADIENMTVAQIAERYRGSAGGTAFSISGLPLPVDPDNKMKWFRYVRITPSHPYVFPEVDAVADVSPALPVDLWRDAHFDWLENPALEHDTADPDGDTIPNLMEYALGRNPRQPEPPALFDMRHYRASDGVDVLGFTFTSNPDAREVRIDVIRTDDLRAPASEWTTHNTRRVSNTLIEAPVTGERGFMRLRIQYE